MLLVSFISQLVLIRPQSFRFQSDKVVLTDLTFGVELVILQ